MDAITMISEGRKASSYDAPKSGEEMRKALTSVALGGAPYLIFDNIKHRFGGERTGEPVDNRPLDRPPVGVE